MYYFAYIIDDALFCSLCSCFASFLATITPIRAQLMAMEPLTLFARNADPAGVARLLRDRVPTAKLDGPDDSWRHAVLSFGGETLTVTHDPAYYSEPNWAVQMDGMRNYFSRFPETERKQIALMLPTTFKFSLGLLFDPDYEPSGDPRLELVYEMASLLDGVLFTPSGFRDKQGRFLYGAGGGDEENLNAVWPRVVAEVVIPERPRKSDSEATHPNTEDDPKPPTAERVARRALALTALTARAILEQEGVTIRPSSGWNPIKWVRGMFSSAERERQDILAWIDAIGIGEELESEEWEVLQRPIGYLEPQQQVNSTWRLEGLVVLAWTLKKFKFPTHDRLVEFRSMWANLGLLDVRSAKQLLANPTVRPRPDLALLRNRLFAIHWRLRNYNLHPNVIDYADFARTAWFGPLDSGLPLIDGDLAIDGKRLDQASPDAFSIAHSASQERHQAINWIWQGPDRYSEASVDT